MLKPYPDRPLAALWRIFTDTVAVVWVAFWALAGYAVYQTVMALEAIADGISDTGRTFNNLIAAFRSITPVGIPGLSQLLFSGLDSVKKASGDQLITTGAQVHDDIQHLAIELALVVAVPPIATVAVAYGLWRWRDARERGAALAFLRAAMASGRVEQARAALAHRAVVALPFSALMKASSDPVGDLAGGDYERLAAAMLEQAGLERLRLPPPPEPEPLLEPRRALPPRRAARG